ncbi:DUF6153 family protein [Streptomyces sp. NPDC001544]|uniref:DUF6153 family protein n=1 Tax=Streptomyces sp. NPDC001544 TaxID=3364584 RepID=UPI0036AADB2A
MTTPEQHSERPPVRWSRMLLVLGVLAGLMAMHALAPGGGLHDNRAHGGMPHVTAVAGAHDGCAGDDCGGGHLQHADPTCKAAAVSGGPALPALAPDPAPVPVHAEAARSCGAPTPDGARAPPSLAELQLLRI